MFSLWSVATPAEKVEPQVERPPSAEIHPKCLNCGAAIDIHADSCSQCGTRFLNRCKRCNTPVNPTWHVCPECGAQFH